MSCEQPFKIDPKMDEYIRKGSKDLRIATTCEGPLIFPIELSLPKPTDILMVLGERRLYVSAVQAPYINVISTRMLPRCALERRR
jgi:hypothetical protein